MNSIQRSERARQLIVSCGALITNDHFVYASGDHGAGWIAKDLINMNPRRPQELGAMLADAVSEQGIEAEIICGPAIGGVICSQYTALALGKESIFAERSQSEQGEVFLLKRRHDHAVRGRRVLVVDDVVNTGYSSRLVIDSVRSAGGEVVALATWINRGNVDAADLGVDHFIWLAEVKLPSSSADQCPLCKQKLPVNTDYAHGAEFVASRS